jgi:diguanylate cyclase (GGDEF)-like protein/PAS domain S-box-containing protein
VAGILERFNLNTHLAAAFAVTTLVLGGTFGLIVGNSVEQVQDSQVAAGLAQIADGAARHLESDISGRVAEVTVAAHALGGKPELSLPAVQAWIHAMKEGGQPYVWLGFADEDGRIHAAVGDGPAMGERVSTQAWFVKGMDGGALIDGISDQPDRAMLTIAAPLRDERGRAIGVLAARLGQNWAQRLSGDLIAESSRGAVQAIVTDATGRAFLASDPTPAASPPYLPGQVAVKAAWPDGKTYLMVGSPGNSALGWHVLVREEAVLAEAMARQMRNRIFSIAAIITVVGAIIGAIAAHRISAPLQRIAAAAGRIRRGELAVRIPQIGYFREVWVLSSALREMVASLRDNEARLAELNAGLEGRVRERTAEIAQAHVELVDREAKLRAIIDTAMDGVMIVDAAGHIETFNRACEGIFGYSAREVLGRSVRLLVPDEENATEAVDLFDLGDVGGVNRTVRGRRRDGRSFPLELSVSRAERATGDVRIAILRDITEQVEARERLFALATQDSLTGLRSRRYLLEGAETEFARLRRYPRSFSVAILDIDYFKRVNDTYGHAAGDAVLKGLAGICRKSLRETDLLGRMGGEEFAIVMGDTDLDVARGVCERLRIKMGEAIVAFDGVEIRFTVSIGLAAAEERDKTFAELLRRADLALYHAKNNGRNRVSVDVAPPHLIASQN